jgi:hypothetical protein
MGKPLPTFSVGRGLSVVVYESNLHPIRVSGFVVPGLGVPLHAGNVLCPVGVGASDVLGDAADEVAAGGFVRCHELFLRCGQVRLGVEWFPVVQADHHALSVSVSSEGVAGAGALVVGARLSVLPVESEGLEW